MAPGDGPVLQSPTKERLGLAQIFRRFIATKFAFPTSFTMEQRASRSSYSCWLLSIASMPMILATCVQHAFALIRRSSDYAYERDSVSGPCRLQRYVCASAALATGGLVRLAGCRDPTPTPLRAWCLTLTNALMYMVYITVFCSG
jgi:hypothetical protein